LFQAFFRSLLDLKKSHKLASQHYEPTSSSVSTGNTEWEQFDNAVKKVFSVPIKAVQKEKARVKMARKRKNQAKK